MRQRRVTRWILAGLTTILATALMVTILWAVFVRRPEPASPGAPSGGSGAFDTDVKVPRSPGKGGSGAFDTDVKVPRSPGKGGSGEEPRPGLQFGGTKLVGRHKGQKQWELIAERIGLPEAGKLVRVKGIRDGTVYKDGKPFLQLSADEAVYQMEPESFTLKGRIRVRTRDGDELQAGELRWDGTSQRLTSRGPVTLSLNGAGVTAGWLVVDARDEKLILKGDVLIGRDKERIHAPEAVYLFKDRVLRIIGPADVQLMLGEKERGR